MWLIKAVINNDHDVGGLKYRKHRPTLKVRRKKKKTLKQKSGKSSLFKGRLDTHVDKQKQTE